MNQISSETKTKQQTKRTPLELLQKVMYATKEEELNGEKDQAYEELKRELNKPDKTLGIVLSVMCGNIDYPPELEEITSHEQDIVEAVLRHIWGLSEAESTK